MSFHPTPRQLETIAGMQIGRMPPSATAKALGIDPRDYQAWQLRLAALRDAEAQQLEREREATQARLRAIMRGGG